MVRQCAIIIVTLPTLMLSLLANVPIVSLCKNDLINWLTNLPTGSNDGDCIFI